MPNTDKTAWAFVTGKPAKCHNAHTDGTSYVLHTSPIVTKVTDPTTGAMHYAFYWHGYYTRTTAAHMNKVLKAMGSHKRVSYAEARDSRATMFVV